MTIDELAVLIADAKAKGLPGETRVVTLGYVDDDCGHDGPRHYPATAVFEDVGGRKVLVID